MISDYDRPTYFSMDSAWVARGVPSGCQASCLSQKDASIRS